MTMNFDEYQYLRSVGGRPITSAGSLASNPGETIEWNFGLLQYGHPGSLRMDANRGEVAEMIRKRIPEFQHTIHVNDAVDLIDLTKLWAHQLVTQKLGREFLGFGQYTGSCVGAGGGNVQATLCFADVILRGENEQIYIPFWPLMYGRSRFYLGDRNRGEGSAESAWAQGIKDGVLPSSESGLPVFYDADGSLQIGGNNEMMWSDGDSKPLIDYLDRSRKFPIEKAMICRNAEDVWNAIGQLNPVGHGSMYGYNVVGKDEFGEYLGKRGPRWSHKETIQGRRIRNGKREFLNVNQWFYQGAKKVWIPEEDVNWICNDEDGECIAYQGLKGIPEDKLRWVDWTKLPV
jgi:hypothetical protein